jgi:hypothetical protein
METNSDLYSMAWLEFLLDRNGTVMPAMTIGDVGIDELVRFTYGRYRSETKEFSADVDGETKRQWVKVENWGVFARPAPGEVIYITPEEEQRNYRKFRDGE